MYPPVAYLGVLLIWSTTPLAIQWSAAGAGVWFAVASRMVIGLLLCLLLLALPGQAMPWHAAARRTYLAGGLGIWGAMSATYWAAQYIPSGLIAVLFGLTPLATGLLAAWWLRENALTASRLLGLAGAIGGLALVFLPGVGGGGAGLMAGITSMLVAVSVHSASAVWVHRIGAGVPALATTTGALLVAVPLFLLVWWLRDGVWPAALDPRTTGAILYLGVAGSTLAFILYYFLLRRLPASRVALIPLLTPVLALILGHWLNQEALTPWQTLGSALVLAGLALWQWGDRGQLWWRLRQARRRSVPVC